MAEFTVTRIRCPGMCCDPVFISNDMVDALTDPKNDSDPQAQQIIDMLSFIGFTSTEHGGNGAEFRCRNFNAETRLCDAYDTRPAMCSAYPYGEACVYCGATS